MRQGQWTERAEARWPLRPCVAQSSHHSISLVSRDWVLEAALPTLDPAQSVRAALSPQVRMAILRIMGQLAVSGFQDRIKGWGLKFVSMQLTLSTYKLVSGPETPTREQPGFGIVFQRGEDRTRLSLNLPACVCDTRTQTKENCR